MTIKFEATDLFGGEANYSWAKRCVYTPKGKDTDRALVRAAKRWHGVSNVRSRTEHFGDTIRIDMSPGGLLHAIFITFE